MRSSGILMPISALPSPYGVGTLGQSARDFVSFLVESGQTYWQILPISPTGFGDSPYQSFSSFAGNPYFIDLDDLAQEGLLLPEEFQALTWGESPTQVDYGLIYRQRFPILRRAVSRLSIKRPQELADFCRTQQEWLEPYAQFMAFKDYYDGAPWSQWSDPIRLRQPQAVEELSGELADSILFWKGVQFLFFAQWKALKEYANRQGISIIGDLPIYVASDSADVWANPQQFQLDENLCPTEVAGCPPDGFSEDGQLWGNPLFNWEGMAENRYQWWMRRVAFQFTIYDVLRIDHFRGFDSYYAIPAGDKNARRGRWRPGPGIAFFNILKETLGDRPIIAEDLGFLTPSVHQMLADTGYPGMKVLEFAFDHRDSGQNLYLPHNYPVNCIAYVGTHDNDTALGWTRTADPDDVAAARAYLNLTPDEGENWGMMRGIWASAARYTIVQMQDALGLGSEGRINTPSTTGENWQWRATPGYLTQELAHRLYRMTKLYGRLRS